MSLPPSTIPPSLTPILANTHPPPVDTPTPPPGHSHHTLLQHPPFLNAPLCRTLSHTLPQRSLTLRTRHMLEPLAWHWSHCLTHAPARRQPERRELEAARYHRVRVDHHLPRRGHRHGTFLTPPPNIARPPHPTCELCRTGAASRTHALTAWCLCSLVRVDHHWHRHGAYTPDTQP